ncbi:MAG: transposase [Clostridia bacterium]|nr:transposase [Clostridia bacterium]
MARLARKDLISNYVHIMSQGINKEFIFEYDFFKEKYWKILENKITEYEVDLICYCIMDNHVHLLLKYHNIDDLSAFMHRLNTSYAKWYNDYKERVGYVFRDRYKTEQILDCNHLYSCINYIHNNPVKAKIVDSPEQYKYSSFKDYLSKDYILNSKIFKFLNIPLKDFRKIFIESNTLSDYYSREISPQEIIDNYLKEKEIKSVKEIVSKRCLKELADILKEKTNLRLDEIANLLEVSRTTLYRIRNS